MHTLLLNNDKNSSQHMLLTLHTIYLIRLVLTDVLTTFYIFCDLFLFRLTET